MRIAVRKLCCCDLITLRLESVYLTRTLLCAASFSWCPWNSDPYPFNSTGVFITISNFFLIVVDSSLDCVLLAGAPTRVSAHSTYPLPRPSPECVALPLPAGLCVAQIYASLRLISMPPIVFRVAVARGALTEQALFYSRPMISLQPLRQIAPHP